ncbi:MAG: chromosome segregation protein SMC [Clostridia bacterium]
MQLKKLEIQGFKSFADKTEIVFLDGVTTIVGPNGSGKSNISDALRWVLGEQSAKNLRGSKMEDIIFAGTQARKKVGFAEVSMYLDNTDSSLPVDYNEVVITRRVYRTGESNYLINGNECRLKDIQEIFMDTGVGKDGYSIISQGKIDEILSSKSEERRHIFEEASGIVKYRTRKDEAARKLSNTDITLSRVSDVLSEIENIIEPLEKKAQIAKEYLLLRDKLKVLDVKLFIDSVSKNSEDLNKIEDIVNTFSKDIENEENNYSLKEAEKNNLRERLQDISIKIEETQNKFFEIQNEAEKINSNINLAASQIENSNLNIVRLEKEISEDTEKTTILTDEISKRIQKRDSLEKNKIKFEEELDQKQKQLDEMVASLDEKGIEIEKLKQDIDAKNEEKYDAKVQISSMEATIESNEKQIEEKRKLTNKNLLQKDSISATKTDIYMELSAKKGMLDEVEKKLFSYNEELSKKADKLNELKIKSDNLNQEIMTLKSKYTYLTNLENENEGYFKSVKSVLDYSKSEKFSKVYGTVASLISTNEKYEYALEIALGGYLQNVVVEDEKEATNLITYLKENKLGRVTFLPLLGVKKVSEDVTKYSKMEGFIGKAIDLIKFDAKFSRAISLALNNTIIVDNIENAIKISKITKNSVKIVTIAGELISSNGSITGGQTLHKSAGLIGRQEKIESLKDLISQKELSYAEHKKFVEQIKTTSDEIIAKINEVKVQKDEFNIQVATYSEKYDNVLKEEEKFEFAKQNSKKAIEELLLENNNFKQQVEKLNKEINQIEIRNNENQETIDEYSRFNKQNQQSIDYLTEDVVNLKISLSSFDESVSSIDEIKEKIEQDIQNFNIAIERKKEQIEDSISLIKENEEKIAFFTNQISEQSNFKTEYLSITNKLKEDKQICQKRQDELDKNLLDCVRKIEKLKEERSKIENKKTKFDIELENIKNKMWDEYELTISSAKSLLESLSLDEINDKDIFKKAEKIRKEIKDLGEVSVSAIEEYKTTKERYDFILTQKEDLEQTKNKLNNLINNMTSIMKTQFEKQFKIITQNFNETFVDLFGGGKAELRLSDEGNILESGIEIEVQPPGKKLQSMMLLSGGERALTATALLFAILKIKTPPFCILDEIEAALDDANVHRFAEYIKKDSDKTQFIVITHRKGTMEVASSVYGVTMQEYGISKVVSMKLK